MNRSGLMSRIVPLFAILAMLLVALPVFAAPKSIILATTTSTQDSGLLDVLVPIFERVAVSWSRPFRSVPARQ